MLLSAFGFALCNAEEIPICSFCPKVREAIKLNINLSTRIIEQKPSPFTLALGILPSVPSMPFGAALAFIV